MVASRNINPKIMGTSIFSIFGFIKYSQHNGVAITYVASPENFNFLDETHQVDWLLGGAQAA